MVYRMDMCLVMCVTLSVVRCSLCSNPYLNTMQVNYNPETAVVGQSQTARVLGIFSAITTIFFAFG